jgi:hypothetical protein
LSVLKLGIQRGTRFELVVNYLNPATNTPKALKQFRAKSRSSIKVERLALS